VAWVLEAAIYILRQTPLEQSGDYWAAQNDCSGSGRNGYLDTPKLVLEVEKEGPGTCLHLCLLTVDGNRP
jgi:hypothetical protein